MIFSIVFFRKEGDEITLNFEFIDDSYHIKRKASNSIIIFEMKHYNWSSKYKRHLKGNNRHAQIVFFLFWQGQ